MSRTWRTPSCWRWRPAPPWASTYFITNDEHVQLWPIIRRLLQSLHLPHRLQPLPIPVAMAAASVMEWQASLTGREPLLTRYSVGVLARTQTYKITAARRDLGYAPDRAGRGGHQPHAGCSARGAARARPPSCASPLGALPR